MNLSKRHASYLFNGGSSGLSPHFYQAVFAPRKCCHKQIICSPRFYPRYSEKYTSSGEHRYQDSAEPKGERRLFSSTCSHADFYSQRQENGSLLEADLNLLTSQRLRMTSNLLLALLPLFIRNTQTDHLPRHRNKQFRKLLRSNRLTITSTSLCGVLHLPRMH